MKKYRILNSNVFINASIFLSVLTLLPKFILAQSESKELSLSKRVQNLSLDSTTLGEVVYYSKNYLGRAEKVSELIKRANIFYFDSLGINAEVEIALLDTVDYNIVSPNVPYGLPFVNRGLIFLPADTSIGAVKGMYSPFAETASEKIILNLEDAGYEYNEALNQMVDLIGLHELGHVLNDLYGIDSRQAWFDEFMASYFGYAYMQTQDTTLGIIWDNITNAGFEEYNPNYKSLDDFNKLYIGVGVGNYCWFQNAFQERIRIVYSERGLEFIRLVKEKLSDPSFKPETAIELLEVLEEIEPGFFSWASSLEK